MFKQEHDVKIDILPANERGLTETEWLESHHSFSFGRYHNLSRLNFGTLRVFNEDTVQPSQGFAPHTHENMEIVTIVLEGTLAHKDSAGHKGELKAYDIQRMTAGKGIEHSEMNPSSSQKVHFIQIWVHPQERNLTPSYEQKHFARSLLHNTLYPVVAPITERSSLFIHQDATFYLGELDPGYKVTHKVKGKTRGLFLFVIHGQVKIDTQQLGSQDAAQITNAEEVTLEAVAPSAVLMIEVGVSTL